MKERKHAGTWQSDAALELYLPVEFLKINSRTRANVLSQTELGSGNVQKNRPWLTHWKRDAMHTAVIGLKSKVGELSYSYNREALRNAISSA